LAAGADLGAAEPNRSENGFPDGPNGAGEIPASKDRPSGSSSSGVSPMSPVNGVSPAPASGKDIKPGVAFVRLGWGAGPVRNGSRRGVAGVFGAAAAAGVGPVLEIVKTARQLGHWPFLPAAAAGVRNNVWHFGHVNSIIPGCDGGG